jgi:hypothetical protein
MSLDAQINALRQQLVALEEEQRRKIEKTVLNEFKEAAKNPANFEYFMPKCLDFMRMVEYNDDYRDMSYAQFIAWNMEKIKNLSNDDIDWLKGLCRRIRVDKIRQMDLDNCVEWDSCGFYYDPRGHLCIMHPR